MDVMGAHVDGELQVISDGDGLAVFGSSTEVERFVAAHDLPSWEVDLPRLSAALCGGSGLAQVGSDMAANFGRWIKLTEKSAKALKDLEPMKGSADGVSRAVMRQNGRNKHILEFVTKPGARAVLTNPAMLAGAAGIMAQMAMQQTMDEITDYLATIDAKVDDILRAQKDSVVADMIAVGFLIDEAMTIRAEVGRVSEVTWSKVQSTSMSVARTQAYALRQLDALAERLEKQSKVGDLVKTSKQAEVAVHEWLAVLARCFQLQEATAVLELDRVLDATPDDVEQHRLALRAARDSRRDLIAKTTQRLLLRIDAAAGIANAKVLLNPRDSAVVVRSSNVVNETVTDFHQLIGIEQDRRLLEAKRWVEAAVETRDKAFAAGAQGVSTLRRGGGATWSRARSMTSRLSSEISERAPRRRESDKDS